MKLERLSLSPSAPCSVPIIQTSSLPLHLNELALFAGAGGGILGGLLCGFRTVCAVEWDAYARDVLVARQNDGCLHPFPIWDDVQTFDGRPWRGIVDVVSGGFPCQDISAAGKGAGIDGERSGMWRHMARIIGEVQPRFVLVENSPMLVGRGGARVAGDLASMGYARCPWGVVGAHHAGAPHKRDRIWFVADANRERGCGRDAGWEDAMDADAGGKKRVPDQKAIREAKKGLAHADSDGKWTIKNRDTESKGDSQRERIGDSGDMENANRQRQQEQRDSESAATAIAKFECAGWWATEPDVGRVAHGVAARVDRLRCLGNGQVPAVVELAWKTLRS